MADTSTVVHIGENSPEQVAFKLMGMIANIEHVSTTGLDQSGLSRGWTPATREYVLDTYAECLLAIRSPSGRTK